MIQVFKTPFRSPLELKRYPISKKDPLLAWDSADELILQHLRQQDLNGKRILILNDQFGALSCALEDFDITCYTDSYVSSQGIQLNSQGRLQPICSFQDLSGFYDLVLIRLPKNMSFFEDLLCHLSQHLKPQSKVICGYRVKHQANVSFDLLNKYMGATTTSLAQKKARLIFATFERTPVNSPYPLRVPIESFEIPFVNHSNLFSREKLDIGTRFLLGHIPRGNYEAILDLGCANGIIGIAAKKQNLKAKLVFSDESQMAIQSARTNYGNYFSDEAQFLWTHCYENQKANSLDLVICNPPFHQGNIQGDFLALQMFKDAHHALKENGSIRVIGNSHLQYQVMLKRIFGNSQIVATHPKFMIVDATKSSDAAQRPRQRR